MNQQSEHNKRETNPDPAYPPVDIGRKSKEDQWLEALGLEQNPFPVVPDVNNFFMPEGVTILLAEVIHTILRRRGFIVITGEVGLGKTTISRRLLGDLEKEEVSTALVFNTFLQGAELLNEINKDFGIVVQDKGMQAQLEALNSYLLEQNLEGGNCAIIIDDAQHLTMESLEMLRQISNLETDTGKLVQVLLIGQPELEEKLNAHELRQLKSRIALFKRVNSFNLKELTEYVEFKLDVAGGMLNTRVTSSAFELLYELSDGNPRKINMIMDRALYAAVVFDEKEIDRDILEGVAEEMELHKPAGALIPAPQIEPGFQNTGRWIATAAAALVMGLAGLGAGIYYPSGAESPGNNIEIAKLERVTKLVQDRIKPEKKTVFQQVEEATPVAKPVEPKPAVVEKDAAAIPVPKKKVRKVSLNPAVTPGKTVVLEASSQAGQFLDSYGLGSFAGDFAKALQRGWLGDVERNIREATGMRLVALTSVPEFSLGNRKILSFSFKNKKGEYLLFWKPKFWVKKFYYGYTDDEIKPLQKHLKKLGLYNYYIDGIVGRRTMKALHRFKGSLGLPQNSGAPDTATLFLLEQAAKSHDESYAAAPVMDGKINAKAVSYGAPYVAAPEDVRVFLDSYGLSAFQDDFLKAQQEGRLKEVESKIVEATGKRLAAFKDVPEWALDDQQILGFTFNDREEVYLLFWEPALWVKNFYYGYSDNEIIDLQKSLALLGLYHGKLDGKVGPKTMMAMWEFKRSAGLSSNTDYPDAASLFLLERLASDVVEPVVNETAMGGPQL